MVLNVDTSERRSEIPGKFRNVVLEKDGEDYSWTDRVRNEEGLRRVQERNVLQTVKGRWAKWIGHILRRNCPLKDVTEVNVEERSDRQARKTT
jgi:hypothetical protein